VWNLGGELLWMDEGHGAGVMLVAAARGGGGPGSTLVTGKLTTAIGQSLAELFLMA
jgi:hypothetical protein